MKKNLLKKAMVCTLACMLATTQPMGNSALMIEAQAYTQKTATVKATSLNVRSGAGTNYSKVATLAQGTQVTVTDEVTAADGSTWYKISYTSGGTAHTGYAAKAYLKLPTTYTTDSSFESKLTEQGFPESYKVLLREIHAEYPNWTFTAQKTGLDWEQAIAGETVTGRNLVYKSSISSWKSIADGAYDWNTSSWPGFDSSSWVAASNEITRYYMDPRNFLDSTYVFQFLTQSYDAAAHNAAGVESLVKGTFMESKATGATINTDNNTTTDNNNNSSSSSEGVGLVGPGGQTSSSNQSGGNSQAPVEEDQNTGSAASTLETTAQETTAPASSSGVSLEAPHAQIEMKNKIYVGELGPGMTGGPGASSSGNTSSPAGTDNSSSGSSPSSGSASYVDIIMSAGASSGVNPYVLASMIIQEQGTNGTSGLISGSTGYYNFFNIEAYQSGSMSAVDRGLWWASQSGNYGRPWSSVEKAIVGGAQYYGDNYVKTGQDTFYLKKFNVQGSNLYKHQYMTNVQGAASEGAKLAVAYSNELKATALNFKIPIYSNMPDSPAVCPTIDGSPNNKLSGIGVDGFALTPTFDKDTASYDLIVDPSVSDVTISASVIDSKATVSGTGTVNLTTGINTINIDVKAENGTVRTYVLNVVRQNNGPTYNSNNSTSSSTSAGSSSGPGGTVGPGVSSSGTGSTESTESTEPITSSTTESSSGQTEVKLIGPGGN